MEGEKIHSPETTKPFLEFEHNGQNFKIEKSPITDSEGKKVEGNFPGGKMIQMSILDDQGSVQGEVLGELVNDTDTGETELTIDSVKNTKSTEGITTSEKLEGHVPGLVLESLAQTLVQEKFDKLTTTPTGAFLGGGEIMLKIAQNDPRLEATKKILPQKDPDTGKDLYQYTFTKAK